MKRVASSAAVMAALVAVGCSRDHSGAADETSAIDKVPGVGVVSANELGPQNQRFVPVTTTSKDARAVFERGRELTENIRQREAVDKFERAIAMDPEFALAHAYLAFVTDDKKTAEKHFDVAMELADRLDASERLVIKSMRVRKSGDGVEERRIYEELSKLAPKDWRVAMWTGESANRLGDMDGAIEAFELAIELNPEAAEPYNTLGYVYAYRSDWDKAVAAAERYAELKPSEPNPQDSLGEILMMAGRYEEAEKAFLRAVEIAPSFSIAWQGAALTHCYRDQWDQALTAWNKARDLAPVEMKFSIERQIAFTYLAAGKTKRALAQTDSMEKLASKHALAGFELRVSFTRADLLHAAGNYKAAHKQLRRVIDELGDTDPNALYSALVRRLWAEVEGGKTAQARKTLATLEEHVKAHADKHYAARMHFPRGAVALATGDTAAAIEHLERSSGFDKREGGAYVLEARWQLIKALEQAGQTENAQKLRAEAARSYRRDAAYVAERNRRFGSDS